MIEHLPDEVGPGNAGRDAPPPPTFASRALAAFWITAAFGGAFVVLNVIGAAVILQFPDGGEEGDSIPLLVGTIVIELLLIGFATLVVRYVYDGPFMREMRWRESTRIRTGFLVAIGVELAIAAMVTSAFFPSEDTPIEQLLDTPAEVVMFAVFGVLFAPIIEELLFRGFLFRVLEDAAGAAFAVPVTAVMFGALHMIQLQGNWAAIALILVVGSILSILRWKTGSLVPSVIVHATYNSMIFLVVLLGLAAQELTSG